MQSSVDKKEGPGELSPAGPEAIVRPSSTPFRCDRQAILQRRFRMRPTRTISPGREDSACSTPRATSSCNSRPFRGLRLADACDTTHGEHVRGSRRVLCRGRGPASKEMDSNRLPDLLYWRNQAGLDAGASGPTPPRELRSTMAPMPPGALDTDLYQLTMMAGYDAAGLEAQATFELYVRSLPARTALPRRCRARAGARRTWSSCSSPTTRFASCASCRSSRARPSGSSTGCCRSLRFTGDVWAVARGHARSSSTSRSSA